MKERINMYKVCAVFLIFLSLVAGASQDSLNFHLSCDSSTECIDVTLDGKTLSIRKNPEMVFDSSNVKELNESQDQYGMLALTVRLNDEATKKLAEVTAKNITKHLVIVLDGKALIAPIIQSRVTGGALNLSLDAGEKHKFWDDIPWMREKITKQKQTDQRAESQNTLVYVAGGLVILIGAVWYGFKGRKGSKAAEEKL
jgi:hypothetical protein